MTQELFFWHVSLSPHMQAIYVELAALGHSVTVVCYSSLSSQRLLLGWSQPAPNGYDYILLENEDRFISFHRSILEGARAIHFYQGIYGSQAITKCIRQWSLRNPHSSPIIITEPPNLNGFQGFLRRLLFRYRLQRFFGFSLLPPIILAMGGDNEFWSALVQGIRCHIFPFGYFSFPSQSSAFSRRTEHVLSSATNQFLASAFISEESEPFHIAFVGQLIHRKNIIAFLRVVRSLGSKHLRRIFLHIVGSGPLSLKVKRILDECSLNYRMYGALPHSSVRSFLSFVDLLVLPSRYDGWGMVAQEALISGARVIVSKNCGIYPYVERFSCSSVWSGKSFNEFRDLILASINRGPVDESERASTSAFASSIFSPSLYASSLSRLLLGGA